MISLKSAIPRLMGIFPNLSEHALYERQRSLVRAGLLNATEGRGPGSGVKVSPDSLATLMISLLATDSLSEVAETTAALCAAKRRATDANRHFFAGAKTLQEAVVLALSSDEENNQFRLVSASRPRGSAMGWAKSTPPIKTIENEVRTDGIMFRNADDHIFLDSKFRVLALLQDGAFSEIREFLNDIRGDSLR